MTYASESLCSFQPGQKDLGLLYTDSGSPGKVSPSVSTPLAALGAEFGSLSPPVRTLRTAHKPRGGYFVYFNVVLAKNMTFKYNTRQFIKEMECRPCLWNVNTAEYNDKSCRESAWVQIAEIMYDEWDDLDLEDKAEKVKDLQKKWKGLRDYHTRVQNKKYTPKKYVPELQLQRGRKRPFLDMLSFLNAKKKNYQVPQNQPVAETNQGPVTIKPSNLTILSYKKAKPSPVSRTRTAAPQTQTTLPPPPRQPAQTQESTGTQSTDPDANFLFSILPDMKSMTPTQNFEFRFQVMKLIKDMKYNQQYSNYYVYHDRGSIIQEQDTVTDPISNESAVSSPEDRKVTIHDSE